MTTTTLDTWAPAHADGRPWHYGKLAAFDLETTGVDPHAARIVTACVAVIDVHGPSDPRVAEWLVNPGIPIPEEATKVHGITNERAAADGQPPAAAVADIIDVLTLAWGTGAVVVGHNVAYDLTVLASEAARHGLPPLEVAGPVVDTLVLDKHVDPYRKGKRTLGVAAQHYNAALGEAHNAAADAMAAARIAWRIAELYPDIAALSAVELHARQVTWAREQGESLRAYFTRQGKQETVALGWPIREAGAS